MELTLTRMEAVHLTIALQIALNESPQFLAKLLREEGTEGVAKLESIHAKLKKEFPLP